MVPYTFRRRETMDLLKTLAFLFGKKKIDWEETNSLSYVTKARLIRSDPVTTARYFHHRVQAFFTHFLLSAAKLLGQIVDYFMRIEFQHRVSPHVHSLLWVENALVHTCDEPQIVNDFIDNYTSSIKSTEYPELIRRQ